VPGVQHVTDVPLGRKHVDPYEDEQEVALSVVFSSRGTELVEKLLVVLPDFVNNVDCVAGEVLDFIGRAYMASR
jgi:hypothetical protein